MSYRLWIDDQINDPETPDRHVPNGWIGAKSSRDAIRIFETFGVPEYISFDHDLGLNEDGSPDTAMVICKWLANNFFDADIEYDVHSKNPIGRKNIQSFMDSWKRSK